MCHTYHMNPLTTNEPLIILNHSSFWTRDSPKAHWPQGGNNANNTNIFKHTDIIFLKHTDLTDLTDFEPSARCERQLIVNDSSLWLMTRYDFNDKSKKLSVSHAKHWQIREICEIRVR